MCVKYTINYTGTILVSQIVDTISPQPKIQVLTREPPIVRTTDVMTNDPLKKATCAGGFF